MARVLVFQHGADIPPGHLGKALIAAGFEMEIVAPGEGDRFPGIDGWAGVVSLGGVMAAFDEAEHPWLVEEKRFLAAAVRAGVPTLGICLGAQLLADALGGRAFRAEAPEIGMVAVALTPEGRRDPVAAGLEGVLPTWHLDTFEIPPGATLLASSDRHPHAFRYGSAVGIQAHPEVDPAIVARWVAHPKAVSELADAGLDPAGMLARVEAHAAGTAAAASRVFGAWAASL